MFSVPSYIYLASGLLNSWHKRSIHSSPATTTAASSNVAMDGLVCAVMWAVVFELLSRCGLKFVGWIFATPIIIVLFYMAMYVVLNYLH